MNVQLFGGLRMQHGGQLIQIPRLRERTLLAFLLLHPESPHTREKLIDLLWPERDSERNGRNFANVFYRLQQVVGKSWFVSEGATILLHLPADATLDTAEFNRLRHLDTMPAWEEALALYSNGQSIVGVNLLPDHTDDWLLPLQTYFHECFLTLLQQLASKYEQEQQFDKANHHFQRLFLNDPLNEDACAGLMRTFARLGRLAEAIESYQRLAEVLQQELKTTPSANLRALSDTLKRTPAYVESSPLPTPISPETSPTASALHNIPKPLSRLVGRKKELDQIGRLLANHRLITITGAGGSGKTRLAIECGRQLADTFEQGACWVDLSALNDETLLAQSVAQSLGMELSANHSTNHDATQQVCEYLISKQLLLILDNCEHLVQGCAIFVEKVLQSCGEVQVLATSREPLAIAGEMVWLTPTLAVPEDAPTIQPSSEAEQLASLLRFPAIQLFVERAQAARNDFALTSQNLPAVIKICQQLDGIPLAIELAAARIKVLSISQLAERLTDRFRLLVNPQRNALPRQQTLHALIDWSYSLLNEPEKRLLRQLAVFSGGFNLEAAEALGGEETLEWLARLVDKSMVLFFERQGEARYRLLETIRHYAWLRLEEAGESDAQQLHHAEHFIKLAEQAERNLTGSQQQFWIQLLEREHDNLRNALRWAVAKKQGLVALQLVRWLGRFWFFRGYYREGGQWVKLVLEANAAAAQLAEPTSEFARLYARTLFHAGRLSRPLGNYAATNTYFEQSLHLARQQDDPRTVAVILNSLGVSAMEQNHYARAQTIFAESLAILEKQGNLEELSSPLLNLSQICIYLGKYEEAQRFAERTITICRQLQEQRGYAFALEDLAAARAAQGDRHDARQLLLESLAIHRQISGSLAVATILCHLAELALLEDNTQEAASKLAEATTLMVQSGVDDMIFAHTASKITAYLALAEGNLPRAAEHAKRTLFAVTDENAHNLVAYALIACSALALVQGQPKLALIHLAVAENIIETVGIVLAHFDKHYFGQCQQTLCNKFSSAEFARLWQQARQTPLQEVRKRVEEQ